MYQGCPDRHRAAANWQCPMEAIFRFVQSIRSALTLTSFARHPALACARPAAAGDPDQLCPLLPQLSSAIASLLHLHPLFVVRNCSPGLPAVSPSCTCTCGANFMCRFRCTQMTLFAL